jgi:hypothetical protein
MKPEPRPPIYTGFRTPPDRKSQGARSLTGLYVRQRSDSPAFFTAPAVRAEPVGTAADRQRGAVGLDVRPPATRSGDWPRAAPCQRRPVGDGCPHTRRGNHRIFGDDLLHRHPGGAGIPSTQPRHDGSISSPTLVSLVSAQDSLSGQTATPWPANWRMADRFGSTKPWTGGASNGAYAPRPDADRRAWPALPGHTRAKSRRYARQLMRRRASCSTCRAG